MSSPSLDQAIQTLADAIGREYSPEKIILFGSQAYGIPTPNSDVDLLVVMKFTERPFRKALEILKRIAPLKTFALDLKVYTPEELASRYQSRDPLVIEATEKGRILYEQSSLHKRGDSA